METNKAINLWVRWKIWIDDERKKIRAKAFAECGGFRRNFEDIDINKYEPLLYGNDGYTDIFILKGTRQIWKAAETKARKFTDGERKCPSYRNWPEFLEL